MTLEGSTLDSGDSDGSVAHGKQSQDDPQSSFCLPSRLDFQFGVWTRLSSASSPCLAFFYIIRGYFVSRFIY